MVHLPVEKIHEIRRPKTDLRPVPNLVIIPGSQEKESTFPASGPAPSTGSVQE